MAAPEPAAASWFRSGEPRRPTRAELTGVRRDLVDRLLDVPELEGLARPFVEPRVRGKVMVLYNREGRSAYNRWTGLFSEFHSVLGALVYAKERGALGVRVDYRSPFYLDPARGPSWWAHYFERSLMLVREPPDGRLPEVHLTRRLARYGRYFGFGHVVNGRWGHLYPMTWGRPRAELAGLVAEHMAARPEIRAKVDDFVRARFPRPGWVLGVHYRGTDSARHYPYHRAWYDAYLAEVRRMVDRRPADPWAVFVATDEQDFLDQARAELGADRVIAWEGSPRAPAHGTALHFDATLPPYVKGESVVVDCLLLAACDYLVKGRSNVSDASLLYNPTLPYSFHVG